MGYGVVDRCWRGYIVAGVMWPNTWCGVSGDDLFSDGSIKR